MPSRTPYGAVTQFLDPIQRSLSCVTRDVIDRGGGYRLGQDPPTVSLGDGLPVPLRGTSKLSFRMSLTYSVTAVTVRPTSYRTAVVGYMYTLHDVDALEVVSFQWHPHGRSPITYPHFHLGAGAQVGRRELQNCHIPTGMIALEQVIRLEIEELGVEPLRGDWDDVLREGQTAFEE